MTKAIHIFEYKHSTNLGDEIQTIAAMHVLKKLGLTCAGFTDRNNHGSFDMRLLVNGFIESQRLQALMQKNIEPIFSNVHLDRPELCPKDAIEALKQHEPIGCRDRYTESFLRQNGIEAFFNYCLTLTFDRRDKSIKGDKVFVVDIDKDIFLPLPAKLKNEKIKYISHDSGNFYSHECKMKMAQELLDTYKTEAKLIVTSRLHCALPCIAMGIPVVFFGNRRDSRLRLVEEFIPMYPVGRVAPALRYSGNSFFLNILFKGIRETLKLFSRGIFALKHYSYYKNKVNWQPEAMDIEDIKQQILSNVAKKIEGR